jgi:hypothetical protein
VQDFGDQLCFRAVGVVVLSVFVLAIDPEPEGFVHAEFHRVMSDQAAFGAIDAAL